MRAISGAVLPLVLMVVLVMAAASFALSFTVTLDAKAARSAVSAAQARAQAAGALALAVRDLEAALAAGSEPASLLGPWPDADVHGSVRVEKVGTMTPPVVTTEPPPADPPTPDAPVPQAVYTLTATATQGRAVARAGVTLTLTPEVTILHRF